MLDNARKYLLELKNKLIDTWYDEKYKFYFSSWHTELQIEDNDWNTMNFVSIDKDRNILGYMHFSINRITNSVDNFGAINFSGNKLIFGKDLHSLIHDIFYKYKFDRMEFYVVIGNPIEKSYDKLIKKYNGRIVGITRNSIKTIDGNLYNQKIYEILKEDFISAKGVE